MARDVDHLFDREVVPRQRDRFVRHGRGDRPIRLGCHGRVNDEATKQGHGDGACESITPPMIHVLLHMICTLLWL